MIDEIKKLIEPYLQKPEPEYDAEEEETYQTGRQDGLAEGAHQLAIKINNLLKE